MVLWSYVGLSFGTACDLKKHETKKAGIFPDGKKKEDEEMRYEIKGDTLPVVICYLDGGEQMITERGSMSWMSPNMKMETTSNGGIGKALGRMFAGEALFQNRYTAEGGNGLIAFASSFPGQIVARQISPGNELIVQKSGFLAAESGVELSVFFQKKLGAGFFGGEGFIMQRLSGQGMAFLEFDGHVVEYELQPGQQIVVDTGYLAAMESSCSMEIKSVRESRTWYSAVRDSLTPW